MIVSNDQSKYIPQLDKISKLWKKPTIVDSGTSAFTALIFAIACWRAANESGKSFIQNMVESDQPPVYSGLQISRNSGFIQGSPPALWLPQPFPTHIEALKLFRLGAPGPILLESSFYEFDWSHCHEFMTTIFLRT